MIVKDDLRIDSRAWRGADDVENVSVRASLHLLDVRARAFRVWDLSIMLPA